MTSDDLTFIAFFLLILDYGPNCCDVNLKKAYNESLNSPTVYTYREVLSLQAFYLGELLTQKSSDAVSRSFAVD